MKEGIITKPQLFRLIKTGIDVLSTTLLALTLNRKGAEFGENSGTDCDSRRSPWIIL